VLCNIRKTRRALDFERCPVPRRHEKNLAHYATATPEGSITPDKLAGRNARRDIVEGARLVKVLLIPPMTRDDC
jgi:hypothetical protein